MRTERLGYPYLKPGEHALSPGAWARVTEAGSEPLPEVLPHWDYSVDVCLRRKLVVHPAILAADCGLDSSTVLGISVSVTSGEQPVRRNCLDETYVLDAESDRVEIDLDINLPGNSLQGRMDVATLLTVRSASSHHPLAPTIPGARLWEDTMPCQLESGGGRLGMEAEDFSKGSPEIAEAPWFFLVGRLDLQEHFGANVRVTLNEARSDVIESIRGRDPVALGFLATDLVRHVLTRVLDDPEFSGEPTDFEPDSVGRTASYWMSAAFPGKDRVQVAGIRNDQPELFEATIASTFGSRHDR